MLAIPTKVSAAIYCRLSKEDGFEESSSIKTQKALLENYCKNNNYSIFDIYIDDGYSGTSFDRPAFNKMLEDIKNRKINLVVTKDLSRLGRNYIKTGYYTDYFFPENNVRYVAINDNIDTGLENESSMDLAPFKNVINEWYAKDVSKKIKTSISVKQKKGEISRTCLPIYGYLYKDNEIIIDEEASDTVRYIYNEYAKGVSIATIATNLKQKRILIPGVYFYTKLGTYSNRYENYQEEDKYNWSPRSIRRILYTKEYLGYLITHKHSKLSFKRTDIIRVPHDQRYYFEGKRPRIISNDLYDLVKRRLDARIKKNKTTEKALLRGILCCECGRYLLYRKSTIRKSKGENKKFYAGYYCKYHEDNKYTYHLSVQENVINAIINKELERVKQIIINHKEDILLKAKNFLQDKESEIDYDGSKVKLQVLKEQAEKIDYQIQKLFEEHLKGNIPLSTYESMMKKYCYKKNDIDKEIFEKEKYLRSEKVKTIDYEKIVNDFINQIESSNLEDLTHEMLLSIFKRIIVKRLDNRKYNYDLSFEFEYCIPEDFLKEYE